MNAKRTTMSTEAEAKKAMIVLQKFSIGTIEIKRTPEMCVSFSDEHLKLYMNHKNSGERICIKLKAIDMVMIEHCFVMSWKSHILFLQTTAKRTREIQKLCDSVAKTGDTGWYDPASTDKTEQRILLVLPNSMERERQLKKHVDAYRMTNSACGYKCLDPETANAALMMISQAIIDVQKSKKKGPSTDRTRCTKRPLEEPGESSIAKSLRSRDKSNSGEAGHSVKSNSDGAAHSVKSNSDGAGHSVEEMSRRIKVLRRELDESKSNVDKLQQQNKQLLHDKAQIEHRHKEEVKKLEEDRGRLKEITETVKREVQETLAEQEKRVKESLAEQEAELKTSFAQRETEHEREKVALQQKYASLLASAGHEKIKAEASLGACKERLQKCECEAKEHQASLTESREALKESEDRLRESEERLRKSAERLEESEARATDNTTSLVNLRGMVRELLMHLVPELEDVDIKINENVDHLLKELLSQQDSIS